MRMENGEVGIKGCERSWLPVTSLNLLTQNKRHQRTWTYAANDCPVRRLTPLRSQEENTQFSIMTITNRHQRGIKGDAATTPLVGVNLVFVWGRHKVCPYGCRGLPIAFKLLISQLLNDSPIRRMTSLRNRRYNSQFSILNSQFVPPNPKGGRCLCA